MDAPGHSGLNAGEMGFYHFSDLLLYAIYRGSVLTLAVASSLCQQPYAFFLQHQVFNLIVGVNRIRPQIAFRCHVQRQLGQGMGITLRAGREAELYRYPI